MLHYASQAAVSVTTHTGTYTTRALVWAYIVCIRVIWLKLHTTIEWASVNVVLLTRLNDFELWSERTNVHSVIVPRVSLHASCHYLSFTGDVICRHC